jgi:hypothetical protein
MRKDLTFLSRLVFGFWVLAASSSLFANESPIFRLDLTGVDDGIDVSGIVRDSASRAPLAEATVSLGSRSAITGADGAFAFAGADPANGLVLQVAATGYRIQQLALAPRSGQRSIALLSVLLSSEADGTPIINRVELAPDGIFLANWPNSTATVEVDWNGAAPSEIRFLVNGSLRATDPGPGPTYSRIFGIAEWFRPSFRPRANQLSVVAVSAEGVESAPFVREVTVLPFPQELSAKLTTGALSFDTESLALNFSVPETPTSQTLNIPVLGAFSAKSEASGEFRYRITDGAWSFDLAGNAGELTFRNFRGAASLAGSVDGFASPSRGFDFTGASFTASVASATKLPLGSFGPLSVLGPTLSAATSKIPGLERALRAISIQLWLEAAIQGEAGFELFPEPDLGDFTIASSLKLEAVYEPDLHVAKARIYVGGQGTAAFGYPSPIFRSAGVQAFAGLQARSMLSAIDLEYVFLNFSHPAAGPAASLADGLWLPTADTEQATWRSLRRSLPDEPQEQLAYIPIDQEPLAAMDMHEATGAPSASATAATLLNGAFINANPSLASRGQVLGLAYTRQKQFSSTTHFTEVAALFFNGSSWGSPDLIQQNPAGSLNPSIAFDGQGRAVAVWMQLRNPSFESEDIEQIGSQMEIYAAWRDPAFNLWSTPVALTDNQWLDHRPRLAGPFANGDLMVVWTENEANAPAGSGFPGAWTNDRVLSRRWEAATAAWGPVLVVAEDIAHPSSESFAVGPHGAVYAWSQGEGNLPSFDNSHEVWVSQWDESSGEWIALEDITYSFDRPNHLVRAAVADEDPILVWKSGSDLMMREGAYGPTTLIRASDGVFDFMDTTIALSLDGRLAVLWQTPSAGGYAIYARLRDPFSLAWSDDLALVTGADAFRDISASWDASGKLHVSYLQTSVVKGTKTLFVSGIGSITFADVSLPGPSKLGLATLSPLPDPALSSNGLSVLPANPMPGTNAMLRVEVSNRGLLPAANLPVAVYDREVAPERQVAAGTLAGALRPGQTRTLELPWTTPASGENRTLIAVVQPNQGQDANPANNSVLLNFGQFDVQASIGRYEVSRDGSLALAVTLANRGNAVSPPTLAYLFREDLDSLVAFAAPDPLGSMPLPAIRPGEFAETLWLLPSGSAPQGESSYRLRFDDSTADPAIRPSQFAVSLNTDDTGDGIPNWWLAAYGLDPSDPHLADRDLDGDGLTVREEFIAGTNPLDPVSRLALATPSFLPEGSGDGLRLRLAWPSAPYRFYRVLTSENLLHWSTLAEGLPATPPVNEYEASVPSGAERRFYRIEVE